MGNHETPKVGVAVVIRRKSCSGTEILMGLRKGSHAAGTWSFPGGHLDLGEGIERCAIREVEEETGLVLREVKRLGVYTHESFPEVGREYVTLYTTGEVGAGEEPDVLEPEKCGGWLWVARNKMPGPLFPGIADVMNEVDFWDPVLPRR